MDETDFNFKAMGLAATNSGHSVMVEVRAKMQALRMAMAKGMDRDSFKAEVSKIDWVLRLAGARGIIFDVHSWSGFVNTITQFDDTPIFQQTEHVVEFRCLYMLKGCVHTARGIVFENY